MAGRKSPLMDVRMNLANKYRPQKLSDLKGQEHLVRTLDNLCHDFPQGIILHGMRGIGKTTTARIIAKGMNCQNGPSMNPCCECLNCKNITLDRHLDVVEIDAASNTGVDDIRQIIDSAKYCPVQARYKVYIIDEVHMLSKNAFNALLKTLEEPPPHVLFILATTELKKIPDTILSRCLVFDLAPLKSAVLKQHLSTILSQEGYPIDEISIEIIVDASEGSARDALSLLTQALALGNGKLIPKDVANMLGRATPADIRALLEFVRLGKAQEILEKLKELRNNGSDTMALIRSLLQETYTMIVQNPNEVSLLRIWQGLSQGYQNIQGFILPDEALEMLLLQLCYLSQTPSLEELYKALNECMNQESLGHTAQETSLNKLQENNSKSIAISAQSSIHLHNMQEQPTQKQPMQKQPVSTKPQKIELPQSFETFLELLVKNNEMILYAEVYNDLAIKTYEPGKLVVTSDAKDVEQDLLKRLKTTLKQLTAYDWQIDLISASSDAKTLAQQNQEKQAQAIHEAVEHPTVIALRTEFSNPKIIMKG